MVTALGAADAALASGTAAAQLADCCYENCDVSGKRRYSLADGVCVSAVSTANTPGGADRTVVLGVFCLGMQCVFKKSGRTSATV